MPPSPDSWEILMHLLSDRGPGTDAVVRFTAASALKDCVDVSYSSRRCARLLIIWCITVSSFRRRHIPTTFA